MVAVQSQRLYKGFFQSFQEEKRTAEKQHLSLDRTSLCQSGYSLVNNSLKNTCGNILSPCSLIQERLNIGLCKNSAT